MSKKNKSKGTTRQGVRDLSHLKSTPTGIRLSDIPGSGMNCEHPTMRENRELGFSFCQDCHASFDEEGIPV